MKFFISIFNKSIYNLLLRKRPNMLVKISKAQLKDNGKNGCILNIKVQTKPKQARLLTPRRIKNKVANFFGQAVQIPISKQKTWIRVEEINNKLERRVIFSFFFVPESFGSKQKNYGHMVNENEEVKLFWSWHFQNPQSHIQSQLSRDISNIETPKKQSANNDWKMEFRLFSPQNTRRRSDVIFSSDEILSEKGQSSYFRKRRGNLQDSMGMIDEPKLQSIIKSRSFVTLSKTPPKIQNISPIKKPQKLEKKVIRQDRLKRASPAAKSPIHTARKQSLNFNRSLNRVGTLVATTLGVFAGLLAGMTSY